MIVALFQSDSRALPNDLIYRYKDYELEVVLLIGKLLRKT